MQVLVGDSSNMNLKKVCGTFFLIAVIIGALISTSAGAESEILVSHPEDNKTSSLQTVSEQNASDAQPIPADEPFVPGEVIIRYKSSTGDFTAASAEVVTLSTIGAVVNEDFSAEGLKGMQMIGVDQTVC